MAEAIVSLSFGNILSTLGHFGFRAEENGAQTEKEIPFFLFKTHFPTPLFLILESFTFQDLTLKQPFSSQEAAPPTLRSQLDKNVKT